jgi:hypothetical protein
VAYTINIIPNRSTSGKVTSFHMSGFWILFWIFTIFIWPVVAYYVAYNVVAPKIIGTEVADMAADIHLLSEVESKNNKLINTNLKLTDSLAEERKYRAEAEARVAIVENARATATENLQKTEDIVFELKNRLSFYNALMEKSAEKAPLQCFNIQLDAKNNNLKYKVNFMIEDVDNKSKKTYNVKFRVIGANRLSINTMEDLPVAHARDITLKRDVHLTGNIKIEKSEDSLRILDIRAYDKSDKLAARCWKAF